MTVVRLQKFLANAGVSSRRKAEELIAGGKVKVNGEVVTELGTKVDDARDVVSVSGKTIKTAERTWIALHKPRGYLSTRKDPEGRPTVYDLLPPALHSLFYVGRLDLDSEGLLLLTNDGDTANRMLHPRYEVERVYEVLVRGEVKPDKIEMLLRGVELEDGVATAESVRVLGVVRNEMRMRLSLREGKKREVRRMLWAVGHKVLRLKRMRYGPIDLGHLAEGKWRKLNEAELQSLVGKATTTAPARKTGKRPMKRGGARKRSSRPQPAPHARESTERGDAPGKRTAVPKRAATGKRTSPESRRPGQRSTGKRAASDRRPGGRARTAPAKRTKRED